MTSNFKHRLADLWLDTNIFSSGTAGILCAWAGLPMLTLAGDLSQNRTGAGVNSSINMPELIVDSLPAYREKAIYYATHPYEFQALRKKLETTVKKQALFDVDGYIKELEKAYMIMLKERFSEQK